MCGTQHRAWEECKNLHTVLQINYCKLITERKLRLNLFEKKKKNQRNLRLAGTQDAPSSPLAQLPRSFAQILLILPFPSPLSLSMWRMIKSLGFLLEFEKALILKVWS